MMMRVAVLALLSLAAVQAAVLFEDTFDTDPFSRWVKSEWKSEENGMWEHTPGDWYVDATVNKGIRVTQDMAHHAISTKLDQTFSNAGQDLVLQFTVKHERKSYSFCGGGYIKLLPPDAAFDQKQFNGDSKYNIMFGPDLCGYDVSRIHLIFRDLKDQNLLKKDEIKLDYDDKNEFTHLYTLILKADGSYKVLFDNKEKASGQLPEGWDFPPKTIDDASDSKPADWVDEVQIPDPEDKKPEGYDDIPEMINDPAASKPEEWDDETDGEYEPPMIKNPLFKGTWSPRMIDNPAYKGVWTPRQVANPDYSPDVAKYEHAFVGFELWTVNNGTIFDNIFISSDVEAAKEHAAKYFEPYSGEKEKAAKEAYEAKSKEQPKTAETAPEDAAEEVHAEDDGSAKKDEL